MRAYAGGCFPLYMSLAGWCESIKLWQQEERCMYAVAAIEMWAVDRRIEVLDIEVASS